MSMSISIDAQSSITRARNTARRARMVANYGLSLAATHQQDLERDFGAFNRWYDAEIGPIVADIDQAWNEVDASAVRVSADVLDAARNQVDMQADAIVDVVGGSIWQQIRRFLLVSLLGVAAVIFLANALV